MSNPKVFVKTHYHDDDPNLERDYVGVEIFDEAGKLLACYGDKGEAGIEKAAGFLEGYSTGIGPVDVTVEGMADADDFGFWD